MTNFNNNIVKFVSVNNKKGVIKLFALIDFRKVLSRNRSKSNFLKIDLKVLGTNAPKRFSSIIINDIKIDFSVHLIPKTMNNNSIAPVDLRINIKERLKEIENNIIKNILNQSYEKRSTQVKKPKITKLKSTVRAISVINRMKEDVKLNNSKSMNKTKSPNIIKSPMKSKLPNKTKSPIKTKSPNKIKSPIKTKEKHVNLEKEDDSFRFKIPFVKKSASVDKRNLGREENNLQKKFYPEMKAIKVEEKFLDSIKYDKYLSKNSPKGKKISDRETFCEGFFISSFPQKDGQVVEKSQSFPASCGHKECSSLPAMKPEILFRYPLEDTKNLELNDLAATICFPTGIKVCYSDEGPDNIKDYVTPITNQKGERYYMITFHFHLKMENDIYSKNYEMHPLKHHLMKFADNYLNMSEEEIDNALTEEIQKNLEQAQDLGFRDNVYIPYSISLISKYPYVTQMEKCVQSIYNLIKNDKDSSKEKNYLNKLIMYLINSIPIPDIHSNVIFYVPYYPEGIEIGCPKLNDLKMNTNLSSLLKLFTIDYIVVIFRFLLFEKKILFIDDDYTRLSNVTDNFISLLYPFQWMHTYIPIMSDQMLKYLETFLPFLNGINLSLMPLVTELFENEDMEGNEEMFLIYIKDSKFKLGSFLLGKKLKKYRYVNENIPSLPHSLEKNLRFKLKKIKNEIEAFQKRNPNNSDLSKFDLKIRIAFIEMFVEMFHDIDKYMCFLDGDVVFNKNLFLEAIPKQDKRFYDEFVDTQLFQLFTQNIIKDELNYFKSKVNEYNKYKKFLNEDKVSDFNKNHAQLDYIINPDYFGVKSKNKNVIEKAMKENFVLQKEENDKRITSYIQQIDNNNYNNENCEIYSIPEEKVKKSKKINLLNSLIAKKISGEIAMKQFAKYVANKSHNNEMSEKEKDAMKEKIKDFTIKIFKSEDIETDSNMKKELQNDLNTNVGREFFISLLNKNTSNIILLQDKSFNLLGTLIYNTLLYMLQVEENNKTLGQIVELIKSTRYFGKEEKEKVGIFLSEEKKNTITLWNAYKQRFQGYPKVNQINFWNKWYDIDLLKKKEKETEKDNESDEIKEELIMNLCDLIIELELNKSFIKNTLEKLIKRVFGKDEEKRKKILDNAVQKIIHAKYVAKPNKIIGKNILFN